MIKQLANIVTGCRIVGSVLLLFFPAFSAAFYSIYIICGLSDMIDGTIARKTNSAGQWGAKFDTAADLVFVTAAFLKILPAMDLPLWLWIWGAAIAMIRIGNILRGYMAEKQLVSLHTVLNKLTGLFLFLLPLTRSFADVTYSAAAVCSIATFAAIQEGALIAVKREHK